jgi:hypothetical protein
MRCAVQVPEHIAARQVPEPAEPERWPEPWARFIPLVNVTLIVPASATRPEAVTVAVLDAIWPLLMPSETEAPLEQAALLEEICTFQSPSKVDAAAGVAIRVPASASARAVEIER